MKRMQTFALAFNDTEDKNYHFYECKIPYYNWCVDILFDQSKMIDGRIAIDECPNHPANPNGEKHNPEDPEFRGNKEVWTMGL